MHGSCHLCGAHGLAHRMPASLDRAKEWAKLLDFEDKFLQLCENQNWTSILICTKHFSEEMYEDGKLKRGAVPIECRKRNVPMESDDMPNLLKVPPIPKDNSGQSDVTYQPSQCSHSSMVMREEPAEKRKRLCEETASIQNSGAKYSLLSSTSFMKLLEHVPGCLRCHEMNAKRTFLTEGTTLVMRTECSECGIWRWSSTEKLHEDPLGSVYEGNIDFCSSVFTAGIPYERVTDASKSMGLGIVGKTQFYHSVQKYTKPAIDVVYEQISKEVVEAVIAENQEDAEEPAPISLLGDAQYDSAGFSASICRYITVDYATKLILDWQILSRADSGGNSPILEKMAFEAIMKRMEKLERLSVVDLTTDKHPGIGALMKTNFSHIKHMLDKWHVVKNIKKLYEKELKLKRNTALSIHWEHILCHIWVSIEAAAGNSQLATELVQSTYWHLQGIHTMPSHFTLLKECPHGPLPDSNAYLNKQQHPAQLQLLHEMLHNDGILGNIRRCAPTQTTSACESFHALAAQIYLPKNIYFDAVGTTTRMKLAVSHHNTHRLEILKKRKENVDAEFRQKYSRAQKRVVSVQVNPPPTLEFKTRIVQISKDIYRNAKNSRILARKVGRPEKEKIGGDEGTDDSASSEDLTHFTSVDLQDVDEEEENEGVTSDQQIPTSVRRTRSSKVPHKHSIFISRKELHQKMLDFGPDADSIDFYDERTGKLLLPI